MGRSKHAFKKKYEEGNVEARKSLFSFFTQRVSAMFLMLHLDNVEERIAQHIKPS